jgi:hypothetical protein
VIRNKKSKLCFDPVGRRSFGKTVALAALTPIVPIAGQGLASERLQDNKDPSPADQKPDPIATTVDSLFAIVRARYSNFLDQDQLAKVKRSVQNGINAGERLKRFKIANGDEPSFVFQADVP